MAETSTFYFIAGPCVIENEFLTLEIARELQRIAAQYPVHFIFKASYDKANRTSVASYRGPGLEAGLAILQRVKEALGVPVVSDVHAVDQIAPAARVLDMLQIPAFLCRQTDLVVEAARTMKAINIKKGQHVSPFDMRYAVDKAASTGNRQILLTERGSAFGYNNLVVDFRSFSIMRALGYPVVFDATHSVQIPSQGGKSGGHREFVLPLARAAAAYGIDGLFCEVHPDPDRALCDGANSLYLNSVDGLLSTVTAIRKAAAEHGPTHVSG